VTTRYARSTFKRLVDVGFGGSNEPPELLFVDCLVVDGDHRPNSLMAELLTTCEPPPETPITATLASASLTSLSGPMARLWRLRRSRGDGCLDGTLLSATFRSCRRRIHELVKAKVIVTVEPKKIRPHLTTEQKGSRG